MKDSGIEWLGEIPEHCDTASFNHYVFLRHGYQFRNYDFTSTGLKVIKITQLKATGELEVNDVSFIDESRLNEFKDILIEEGDILMALTGGTIGKIIRAPKINEPLLQNYRVGNFFSKNDSITKDFLFWVLSSDLILKQIFFDQRETGQPNIGKEDFGRMFLILPNKIEEQDEIVSFIKNEVERINAKKAKTEKLIDLLTEYRTALISEVVTGKVKVI
jgi:type I restriction enzyme S subunit